MTVQELIDKLEKVKDKSLTVNIQEVFNGNNAGWDEVTGVYTHTFDNGEKLIVIE